jgi:hypothetical protein
MEKSLREKINDLLPAARGTVAEVRKPCSRPGCKPCAEGRKHPSFIYVYTDDAGRRRCKHVPRGLVPELRERLERGRQVDRLLFEAGAEFVAGRGGRR